jgi:hypothetical protein
MDFGHVIVAEDPLFNRSFQGACAILPTNGQ